VQGPVSNFMFTEIPFLSGGKTCLYKSGALWILYHFPRFFSVTWLNGLPTRRVFCTSHTHVAFLRNPLPRGVAPPYSPALTSVLNSNSRIPKRFLNPDKFFAITGLTEKNFEPSQCGDELKLYSTIYTTIPRTRFCLWGR
jgi:hypothetical protein